MKSAYDYGPLGVELKRNLMNAWWDDMVTGRDNVVGLDASIIMHPQVWQSSGHAAGFADPLVDCLVSKERFRADKAPRPTAGSDLELTCGDKGQAKTWHEIISKQHGITLEREGTILRGLYISDDGASVRSRTDDAWSLPYRGYVSPLIGSPFLSDERQFNLMFRTALGAVDPMQDVSETLAKLTAEADLATAVQERFPKETQNPEHMLGKALATGDRGRLLRAVIEHLTSPAMAYLRPETAQAMFVQFKNILDTSGQKPPFGIAQMGKSFPQ